MEHRTKYHKFWVGVSTVALITGAVFFIIGLFMSQVITNSGGNDSQRTMDGYQFLVVGIMFLIGTPMFFWAMRFWDTVFREADIAFRPLPTPQEVYNELSNEWGRQPTLQEVADVLQMLTNRKNQALITTGLSFGGLYLIGHHGKL